MTSSESGNDSNDLNKSKTVEFCFIGMNEGFSGWDNIFRENDNSIYYLCNQGIMEWNSQNGSHLIMNANDIGGIVINGPWLYYYKLQEKKINRIKLNGDYSPEIVFDVEMIDNPEILEQISGFTLYNGMLYIKDTTISCFFYNVESKQLIRFNNDMSSGVFWHNKFYYIEHSQRTFSIYSTDIETSHTELVRGDGITYNMENPPKDILYDKLTVVNDKLLYSTRVNPAIYLYQEDGEDLLIEEFNSKEARFIQTATDGNYLYYTCAEY